MMALWIAILAAAGMLLAAAVVGVFVGQPSHVVRTLGLFGGVFGAAFGGSFPALRRAYREAELRKVIAADL